MYKLLCLVVLCVLGITHTLYAQENVNNGGPANSNSDLFIDDKGQRYDELEGSADSEEGSAGNSPYVTDDEDDDEEGSATPMYPGPKTLCQKTREDALRAGLLGSFRPNCTTDGEYYAKQCHSSTGQCWCVNYKGEEIPGTNDYNPFTTDCDSLERSKSYTVIPDIIKQETRPNLGNAPDPTDVVYEETPVDTGDPDQTVKGKNEDSIAIDPPEDTDNDDHDGNNSDGTKEHLRGGGLLRQPLMLAALIAIAVVSLLCAVLLVMFIVYRMRKKDEGSYALDEPKRSPTHPYQRAPTKEFFA